MKKIGIILDEARNIKRPKNISTEFQQYGVYLAESLADPAHYSLYIKMAKNYNRVLLDEALSFAKGSLGARSKARIFMWKLKQLRELQKEKLTSEDLSSK